MPNIVGIRFKSCGKIYDFEATGLEIKMGDRVVIESEFGLSIANVAESPHFVEKAHKDLKKVLRVANSDDFRQKQDNEKFEQEAKTFCYERIAARGLPMKLVCSEVSLDKKRIVFYFTADGRIDFRELVKDLASKFKTRIEMRQIGVRDKAKLVGGFGLCGKELCCRSFLTSFEPISIKMAKQQELTLNTGKLSGSCGRLMCCLGYEYSDEPGRSDFGEDIKTEAVPAEDNNIKEQTEVKAEEASSKEMDAPSEGITKAETVKKEDQQTEHSRRRRRRRRHKKKPAINEQ